MDIVYKTDVGIKKTINQDSLLVRKANVKIKNPNQENGYLEKEVAFLCVFDGMGGLSSGEKASTEVSNIMEDWFEQELPDLLMEGLTEQNFVESMESAIRLANDNILSLGRQIGSQCGTTMAGLLLYNGRYATINVGDSRVYRFVGSEMEQLTHDQSLVQDLIDKGQLTPEEAEHDRRRSTLLQCIGATDSVYPDFTFGTYAEDTRFLLCSDGFRHKITKEEMTNLFSPYLSSVRVDETNNKEDSPYAKTLKDEMKDALDFAIYTNKEREEKDNITAIICRL
jgi:serine/threonine protein phosphatase